MKRRISTLYTWFRCQNWLVISAASPASLMLCCSSSIMERKLTIKVWWDFCHSIQHTAHYWWMASKPPMAKDSVQWADVHVITWGNDRAPFRASGWRVFSCCIASPSWSSILKIETNQDLGKEMTPFEVDEGIVLATLQWIRGRQGCCLSPILRHHIIKDDGCTLTSAVTQTRQRRLWQIINLWQEDIVKEKNTYPSTTTRWAVYNSELFVELQDTTRYSLWFQVVSVHRQRPPRRVV